MVLTPGRGMDTGVRASLSGVKANQVSINARYDIEVTFYWCQPARNSKPKCNSLTCPAVLDPLVASQGNGILKIITGKVEGWEIAALHGTCGAILVCISYG